MTDFLHANQSAVSWMTGNLTLPASTSQSIIFKTHNKHLLPSRNTNCYLGGNIAGTSRQRIVIILHNMIVDNGGSQFLSRDVFAYRCIN
jgi:hypothetical protein